MADIRNSSSPAGSEAGSLYEGSSGARRPTPLADLSKEDLILKCKKLLQIAQKSKVAKDGKKKCNSVFLLVTGAYLYILLYFCSIINYSKVYLCVSPNIQTLHLL